MNEELRGGGLHWRRWGAGALHCMGVVWGGAGGLSELRGGGRVGAYVTGRLGHNTRGGGAERQMCVGGGG